MQSTQAVLLTLQVVFLLHSSTTLLRLLRKGGPKGSWRRRTRCFAPTVNGLPSWLQLPACLPSMAIATMSRPAALSVTAPSWRRTIAGQRPTSEKILQGRKAQRPANRAAHENRVGHQSQDRQSPRSRHPALAPDPRRRGDRMSNCVAGQSRDRLAYDRGTLK